MCPNHDKVTGGERNLQGSSSSYGDALGAQYVPSGATKTRKESERQLFPLKVLSGAHYVPFFFLSYSCWAFY